MASTAEVISPKPIDASSRLIAAPDTAFSSRSDRAQLICADAPSHQHRASGTVGVDLEDSRRVMVRVEAGRAAWPDVADLLAGLQRRDALPARAHPATSVASVTQLG